MNTHEFDDIIKQKAQQRKADVPEDLWEGITEERKRRRFPFFWLILIILFLGGSAVVWHMNKKDKAVAIAIKEKQAEKNNPANNNESNKETNGKITAAPSLDNTKLINPTRIAGKKTTANANQWQTISNKNDISLMKTVRSGYKKTSPFSYASKKQQVNYQSSNDQPGKKEFTSHKNKGNIKANIKLNITAGETDSLTGIVTKEEKIFSVGNSQQDDKGSKEIVIEGAISSLLSETIKNSDDKIVQDKKEQSAVNPLGDSLLAKKITTAADSLNNKKTIAILGLKKSKNNHNKTKLQIEAGITAVSSIQNYKRPLYVKRVLDHTNIHSEFVSDNIKTTVEQGMGLNISLVKNVNKKWSIGAGIQYLRITEHLQMSGIETNINYTIVKRLVNEPGGSFLKPDTLSAVTKDQTTLNGRNIYHSFSIPLFIRYQFVSRKRWAAAVTAGIYVDLLRKYHNSTPGKFETVYTYGRESAESKNTIGIDLFAGLHLSGKLSKKYELFAEPGFRYNLSAYKTNNLSFNKKIHKPTISIGITRKL